VTFAPAIVSNKESFLNRPILENNYTFIKSKGGYERVNFSNILYLKASGAYTNIITEKRSFVISANLSHVVDQMGSSKIVRCHRSYAINIDHIVFFDDTTVSLKKGYNQIDLSMSMGFRSNVINKLQRLKSN
ncbi:MAG: LytTR family DNA-binding domain-containing protein, partial [Saprospiraceae bacterium]|nr:LytTR family DNA-binding domain-containing protein [Saprospiraceae bacterium]